MDVGIVAKFVAKTGSLRNGFSIENASFSCVKMYVPPLELTYRMLHSHVRVTRYVATAAGYYFHLLSGESAGQ